ncbi:efflux RND transporter permease subunit [Plectonema cf. radiosum LEGE 06105]|uniref:Efflux RND transporter permease subunit n=1 Tax=Plectonema cf. radiosum LEGE 06105 TaxID=945769 RepID=A0A8J7F4J2_9CYAN|nr:efflux RND transporter permease subunit [Plectonema radiosum]MBE9214935.1 efflux RND transporter permease subunit [Plectonema cf. radiosum LEGE 06105]
MRLENKDTHSSQNQKEIPNVRKPSRLERFFFLNTIFAILLSLLMVIGGVLGYFSMTKQSQPDIDIAVATITTTWAGADPQTIEQQITDEIETEITSVENISQIQSASYTGFSVINVEFTSDANTEEAIQELRQAVSQAEPELPRDADEPVVQQVSLNDAPIITLALYGNIDATVISQAAEEIQDRLEQVGGVSEVNLGGAREEVVSVQMNPFRLAALGISPTTVANQIRAANRDVPLNEIESDVIGSQVRFYGRFRTVEDLQQLPIARLSGRVVRLNEVASVSRELEQENTRAFISTGGEEYQPVVSIGVVKVPGQDSIEVINRVLETMDEIKQNANVWPFGLEYRIIADESEIIWEQLGNLFVNALQAMAAVFVILFIALSWREALIAGLSIPLTFLGALAVLWLMGQTLNNMVLIGMVLALGILVDVFILMMEGMHEAIFVKGLSFDQAALQTVKTYAGPAFAGQLTTILALTPLMAISGTLGKFIELLPIAAIICLVLSFAIAILVDIPLSRYLLANVKGGEKKSRIDRLSERASERWVRWSLNYTVKNKATARAWALGTIALFACAVYAFTQIPVEFFPQSDQRNFSVNVELPPTTTLNVTQEFADDLGEILREKDYLESVIKYVGQRSNLVSSGELEPNEGSYLLGFSGVLLPEDEREKISYEYLDDLREELKAVVDKYPGASMVLNAQQSGQSGDPIQIEITGTDLTRLREISQQVQMELQQIPGATDVRDSLGTLQADLRLIPKREELSFYGLTEEQLTTQAQYYTRAIDVGNFAVGGNQEDLEIRLSTAWPSRNGRVGGPTRRDELLAVRFFTDNPNEELISASAVVEPVQAQAPLSIARRNARRTATVLAKNGSRTVGEILADLEPKLEEMKKSWPSGYSYSFGGETADQAETFGSAGQALGLAVFLVFAVLVLQLGSFRQPFIILLAIPFALIGTFGGFYLAKIPFSFSAFIGIIALVGIVVNDAIVMVDTMNSYQQEGMKVRLAAARGAADRLRPVLTTSITTIIGLIPLALSDPTWMPLCSAIIFGLLAATLIALVVVPCLYLILTPKTEVS